MERNYLLVVMLAMLMVAVTGRKYGDPSPTHRPAQGVCALPRKAGPCYARCPRYYYDDEQEKCLPFTYGCCRGNANNFATKSLCKRACKRLMCSRIGCFAPPCQVETCPNYPDAVCHQACPCEAMWLYRREDVSSRCGRRY